MRRKYLCNGRSSAFNFHENPPTSSVSWLGNGTTITDGVRGVISSICGVDNGAPLDGNYIQFVLGSTKTIDSAKIKFGADSSINMVKSNLDKKGTSSYKYVIEGDVNLDSLYSAGVVAEYSGLGNPTLTVGQGCQEDGLVPGSGLVLGFAPIYIEGGSVDPAVTAAASTVDTAGDNDGIALGTVFDAFNAFTNSPFADTLDPTSYSSSKLTTAGAIKKADGTVISTGIIVIDTTSGLGGIITDETWNTANLVYATNPDELSICDYVEVTYDGVVYKYFFAGM